MSEELYFNDELRKCLNAAGLSDCGENYAWNYWYHRVHKAHDQAVDRVTEAQRAENAKLQKLAVGMYGMLEMVDKMLGNHDACETPRPLIFGEDKSFKDVMRELGVVE